MMVRGWKSTAYSAVLVVLASIGIVFGVSQSASASANLIIGSTYDQTAAVYQTELQKWSDPGVIQSDGIEITRLFWSPSMGCPSWNDPRILALKPHNVIPFISFKVYDLNCMQTLLDTRPADIPIAYLTWFHEPEQDMDAATYKTRANAMWNVVKNHPSYATNHVKYISIQTKQWTFLHNGGNYNTYWCGCGDFFGVDMYANPWESTYPDPDAFLTTESNFALNVAHKNFFMPELGAVRLAGDPTGSVRAEWINQVMYRADTWSNIRGAIWWDAHGTGSDDFRLDAAHNGTSAPENTPEAVRWRNILSYN